MVPGACVSGMALWPQHDSYMGVQDEVHAAFLCHFPPLRVQRARALITCTVLNYKMHLQVITAVVWLLYAHDYGMWY